MPAFARRGLMVAALAVVLAACRGGDGAPQDGELSGLAGLRGQTVGLVSASDVAGFEARYVLQQGYDLQAAAVDGDVTLREASADALADLLRDGEVDAIVARDATAFRLLDEEGFAVLGNVAGAMRELTGQPVQSTVLATYPDVTMQQPAALAELNDLLEASLTYFGANRDEVIAEVARAQAQEEEFLRWWWDRYDFAPGDRSTEMQERLTAFWGAAAALGDIEQVPDMAAMLFSTGGGDAVEEEQGATADGDRVTISLAVLDGPGRREALYAIEEGLVASELVDLDIAYLSQSGLAEAAPARQYDVIETSSLAVALGGERDIDFVVLSGALQDLGGTLAFVLG